MGGGCRVGRGRFDAAERAKRAKRSGRFGDGAAEGAGPAAAAAAAARRERLASMRFTVAAAADRSTPREETGRVDDSGRASGWRSRTSGSPPRRTPRRFAPSACCASPSTDSAKGRSRTNPTTTSPINSGAFDRILPAASDRVHHEVYEHHARVALRHGDLGEFNQCQTVLRALYDEGVVGRETEFVATRCCTSRTGPRARQTRVDPRVETEDGPRRRARARRARGARRG